MSFIVTGYLPSRSQLFLITFLLFVGRLLYVGRKSNPGREGFWSQKYLQFKVALDFEFQITL